MSKTKESPINFICKVKVTCDSSCDCFLHVFVRFSEIYCQVENICDECKQGSVEEERKNEKMATDSSSFRWVLLRCDSWYEEVKFSDFFFHCCCSCLPSHPLTLFFFIFLFFIFRIHTYILIKYNSWSYLHLIYYARLFKYFHFPNISMDAVFELIFLEYWVVIVVRLSLVW